MDGESCIRKAYEFILINDFEQAIHWFEQAIASEPDNAGYYHKCAVSCARSNKWAKAKVYADYAEKLDPENEEYRYHSQVVRSRMLLIEANSYLALNPPKLAEAEDLLRLAAGLDPLSFDCCYTLAMVFAAAGKWEEAARHAREAIRLNPQHSAARRLFADVNRKRRRLRNGAQLRNDKGTGDEDVDRED